MSVRGAFRRRIWSLIAAIVDPFGVMCSCHQLGRQEHRRSVGRAA